MKYINSRVFLVMCWAYIQLKRRHYKMAWMIIRNKYLVIDIMGDIKEDKTLRKTLTNFTWFGIEFLQLIDTFGSTYNELL